MLEDFCQTARKEYSKLQSLLIEHKNKLIGRAYFKFKLEGHKMACSIGDLNYVLSQVRRKENKYLFPIWDQYEGFSQKVQYTGKKYGLQIDGPYKGSCIDKQDNHYCQLKYFNSLDKNKDLQLATMEWYKHTTFMILDHVNRKIIIFDPNGDFYNLFTEQAELDDINKDSVMKFLFGKDNAEQLKNYDLCDANGVWEKESGIISLVDRCCEINTGEQKLKEGETDGSCAFVSQHWAEKFLNKYFKYIKYNKTKVIKDYKRFYSDLNRKMHDNELFNATNLRNMLKAGFESFYRCGIIKEALFNQNNQASLHTGLADHFPKTIAKFQHLIEHYKYREHNSKMHYWKDAVKKARAKRNIEQMETTRRIMAVGFPNIYGPLVNKKRKNVCQYLNAIKKYPVPYAKKRLPHLGNKLHDAYYNDLNASDLKSYNERKTYNRIVTARHDKIILPDRRPINYQAIINQRRGNLNLDRLPENNKKLNHSII